MTTWTDEMYARLIKQRDELLKAEWYANNRSEGMPDLTDEQYNRLERLTEATWYLAQRGNRGR